MTKIGNSGDVKIFLWKVAFGRLAPEWVEELKNITDNRSQWIRDKIFEQFGYKISCPGDIADFENILEGYHYRDKSEWLRETVRQSIIKYRANKEIVKGGN